MVVTEVLKVPLGWYTGSRGTSTLVLSCHSFPDHLIHTPSHWRWTSLLRYLKDARSHHFSASNNLGPQCTLGCVLLVTLWPRKAVQQTDVFHHHVHRSHALSHHDDEFHLGMWHLLPPPNTVFNHTSLSALQPSIALYDSYLPPCLCTTLSHRHKLQEPLFSCFFSCLFDYLYYWMLRD